MKRYFITLLFLSFIGCASLNLLSPFTDSIIYLKTGEEVSFKTLIKNIKNVRVIIIGETHNQKSHHDIQLKIIEELLRKNSLIAVGMEMFQHRSNKYIEKWSHWKLDEIEMESLFSESWAKSYYPLYGDTLRFIRDANIPLIGLNIQRKFTRKVATKGFKSLSKEERSSIPRVSCDIPQNYRSYLEEIYELNPHRKGTFENFCEAQVLWDSVMAHHAVQFLKENPHYQLIILAGSIHAQRLGILTRIREKMNVSIRIIIPKTDEDQDDREITHAEADYLWITDRNGISAF